MLKMLTLPFHITTDRKLMVVNKIAQTCSYNNLKVSTIKCQKKTLSRE